MSKANILYQENHEVVAEYNDPKLKEEKLEYRYNIQIKDSGKQPITMTLTFEGIYPQFTPMPPEKNNIKAKDLIELYLKLNRWFKKYGYKLK